MKSCLLQLCILLRLTHLLDYALKLGAATGGFVFLDSALDGFLKFISTFS